MGSPVPAQMVLWFASFGSRSSDETLFCEKCCETNSHSGSGASASSVRQTPPLALAIQRVQSPGTQSGEIAAWTVRPLKFSVPAL